SNADFQECYEKAIGAYSVEFLKAELTSDPDAAFMGPVLRNSRVPISAEKVKGIAAMVQRSHLENLRHQIKEGLNDNYACDKDFIKYAYQRVDENALGIRA